MRKNNLKHPWRVFATLSNKSSPSNLREIHFMSCSFLLCSGFDILISFAGLGCSIRLPPLNSSVRQRHRISCPSQIHTSLFCEDQWQSRSYITYVFTYFWTQLHHSGLQVPCFATHLWFLSNDSIFRSGINQFPHPLLNPGVTSSVFWEDWSATSWGPR